MLQCTAEPCGLVRETVCFSVQPTRRAIERPTVRTGSPRRQILERRQERHTARIYTRVSVRSASRALLLTVRMALQCKEDVILLK